MPADHTFKQGDTHPALTDTLAYSNATPADLTGCTVELVMRSLSASSPLALTGTVTVTNPTQGQVKYTPSAADTGLAGLFMANWRVTFQDASQMTFPTVGYITVAIEENLATAGGEQLLSLPDVKDYLNLPAGDRAHDAKLIRFLEAVRPIVENITGPIIPTVREEWHDGGQYFIQLRRTPSTALGTTPILRLVGCEEFQGPTKYPLAIIADPSQGSTYSCMVDSLGTVTRCTSGGGVTAFPAAPRSVRVWYQAGQATVPHNVYEGALELVRVNWQTTQRTGRGGLTPTDELDTGVPLGFFVPRRVRELLAPNRRRPNVA